MKTSEKILQFIQDQGEVSAKDLTSYVGISERAIFKQLSKLIDTGKLIKIGKPPKVFYKTKLIRTGNKDELKIQSGIKEVIERNFLYITPLGEYFLGLEGFIRWCEDRRLGVNTQAMQYNKILKDINKTRKNGMITAVNKFESSFKDNALKDVFYLDFYSIPQFGKTKLGQLLLYAKQSQDRKRIKEIADISKGYINKIVKQYKIEAVGFIPPTIKREVQFMKELENSLDLNLPKVKISKIKTEIIVPQKTLKKINDRIINARNTIILEDKRSFKNILLIDDAAGSGATLNEMAKKIVANEVSKNVYGLAITGSYKGFDVISEV